MQIVNLSEKDVIRGLESPKIYGEHWGDYYRKFTEYDKNNILGLYYKILDYSNYGSLENLIAIRKKCADSEYPWEHYSMCRLFTLINRLEEAYKVIGKYSDLKSPVITGIALYNNYPVGTLFPRELLNYKNISEIFANPNISDDDKSKIFEEAGYIVSQLIRKDIYPTCLYRGNIVVNPNDYSDVRLDGLDGPMVSRVESKEYARVLKKRGGDLKEITWENFNKLR